MCAHIAPGRRGRAQQQTGVEDEENDKGDEPDADERVPRLPASIDPCDLRIGHGL